MNITSSSKLSLVLLEIREDKKHYIVEDLISGDFYEMPVIAIDALRMMNGDRELGYIEVVLKEKYPQEEIDVLDFALNLANLNLISSVNGETLTPKESNKPDFSRVTISPKLGKLAFNKITYFIYTLLFIFNISAFVALPHLIPHYKDVFIFPQVSLNILFWLGMGALLLFIHEFGHILSLRAHDYPARLGWGHRLFFLVVETDMSSAWKLSSKDRNPLFLSGLCFDMVVLAFALTGEIVFHGAPMLLLAVLRLIVFDVVIRAIFQCCVYMKTDLYYVLENITGCYNLMESAKGFLKGIITKGDRETGEVMYEEEKKTIIFYSFIYVSGVILTMVIFTFFFVPQTFYAIKYIIPALNAPFSSPKFIDALFVLGQIVAVLGLLIYSWGRKYRRV